MAMRRIWKSTVSLLCVIVVIGMSPPQTNAQTFPVCNSDYFNILGSSFQVTNGEVTPATDAGLNYGITLTMVKNVSNPTGYSPTSCGFAATMKSIGQLQYGVAEMRVKTASTIPGVVTAFILRSDGGDEIDWEWVGGDKYQAQTNYFWGGEFVNHGR